MACTGTTGTNPCTASPPFSTIRFPSNWRGRGTNQFIATAFDDSLTLDMRMRALAHLIDESLVTINEVVCWINNLDMQVQTTVTNILNGWLSDGTLANILCEVAQNLLDELQQQVDTNTSDIATIKDKLNNLEFPDDTNYFNQSVPMKIFKWEDFDSQSNVAITNNWLSNGNYDNLGSLAYLQVIQNLALVGANRLNRVNYGSVGGFPLDWYWRSSDKLNSALTSSRNATAATGNLAQVNVTDSFNQMATNKTIVITVGIHGNEKTSAMAFMEFMSKLFTSDEPFYKMILREYTLVILPLINPVGFQANVRHDNVTTNTGGTVGIDLNREFGDTNWTAISSSASTTYSTINSRFVRDVLTLAVNPGQYIDSRLDRWGVSGYYDHVIGIDVHNFRQPSLNSDRRTQWVGTNRRGMLQDALTLGQVLEEQNKPYYDAFNIPQGSVRTPLTGMGGRTIQRQMMMLGIKSFLVEGPRGANDAPGGSNEPLSFQASWVCFMNTLSTGIMINERPADNYIPRIAEHGARVSDNVWTFAMKLPVNRYPWVLRTSSNVITQTNFQPSLPNSPGGTRANGTLMIYRTPIIGNYINNTMIEHISRNLTTTLKFVTSTTGVAGNARPWIQLSGSTAAIDGVVTYDDAVDDNEATLVDDVTLDEESTTAIGETQADGVTALAEELLE